MPFLQKDNAMTDERIDELTRNALAVNSPDDTLEKAWKFINWYFSPTVCGLDKLTDKPTLFVGNHSLFGFDAWIVQLSVHHETGRFLRGMGDRLFYESPVGDLMTPYGMILGHPKTCKAMMEAGEDLLVFPGGSGESTKPESEKYTLSWGERYGFVRLAAQNGYNITPFGLVGLDDCYEHLLEGGELLDTWPGRMLGKLGLTEGLREDILPPIPLGLFSTPMPKPQPSFLSFGDTIEVPDCRDKTVSKEVLSSVRAQTAEQIDGLLKDMLLLRAQSTGKASRLRRWLLG
jgi:hypothetical protein